MIAYLLWSAVVQRKRDDVRKISYDITSRQAVTFNRDNLHIKRKLK
jgi:hypothetical protein